jgi:hypothetical protein
MIDWSVQPLGDVSDAALAWWLDVGKRAVWLARTERGIPPRYGRGRDGQPHRIAPTATRVAEAMHSHVVGCRHCGALEGETCRTPSGAVTKTTHACRMKDASAQYAAQRMGR